MQFISMLSSDRKKTLILNKGVSDLSAIFKEPMENGTTVPLNEIRMRLSNGIKSIKNLTAKKIFYDGSYSNLYLTTRAPSRDS